jgi:hypothetical protein
LTSLQSIFHLHSIFGTTLVKAAFNQKYGTRYPWVFTEFPENVVNTVKLGYNALGYNEHSVITNAGYNGQIKAVCYNRI